MSSPQPEQAPQVDRAAHADISVLCDRALLGTITSFQSGYPHAVAKLLQESDVTILYRPFYLEDDWLTMRNDFMTMQQVDNLVHDGVLPHLAIATNNVEMLQVLYKLSKHSQYQDDVKLSFDRVVCCAVLYNRVEMLECIGSLKSQDPDWTWEPHLMQIALRRNDPDVQVLDWLNAHLPNASNDMPRPERDMLIHTTRGDLDVVCWLHEHGTKITQAVVTEASKCGHVHLLRYFYQHDTQQCGCNDENNNAAARQQQKDTNRLAINTGASEGQLEVVKFFLESTIPFETPTVIDLAAANGHLEIVKYLHENGTGGCTALAMRDAAEHGHLEIVKFLHKNRTEGCTPDTLDCAAHNGHAKVVKFLHENYSMGYSDHAYDRIAAYGHLEVVKFLHENTKGEFTTDAMDYAAYNGHLEVVKFLHFNRTEGCTTIALNSASRLGHYGVVDFLLEHRTEGDVVSALIEAASHRRLETVQLLHAKLKPGQIVAPLVEAASQRENWTSEQIWYYLCANQEQEPVSYLRHAIVTAAVPVVLAVWEASSNEDLDEMKRFALEQNNPEVTRIFDEYI